MTKAPNSAQLKDAIDRGKTGDKAAGFDPAAAPLGTDDEAGGASPSRQEIEQALRHETGGKATRAPNSASPSLAPSGAKATNVLPWLLLVAGAAIAIFAGLLIWQSV